LLFVSIILIYTYKYSFHVKDIIAAIDNKEVDATIKEDIENYKKSSNILFSKTGFWGVLFLFISLFFILGSIQTAVNSDDWKNVNSFLNVIFSVKTFVYVLLFVLLSLSVTSATVLFLNFRPNSKIIFDSDEDKIFVKNNLLSIGLVSTLILPLVFVLSVFALSNSTLSAELFGVTALIVLLLLALAVIYYLMIRDDKNYSTSLIFVYVILFLFAVIKDQLAFDQGTELHFNKLAGEYEIYEKELKASMGLETETISGADIYNGRCIACHNFDKVVVGPAYNNVLVKYDGKMDKLVKFILNPVKVNPKFTSMPNQGLKPKEAEAVAEYIMSVYKSNKAK
jgi:cytochrome c